MSPEDYEPCGSVRFQDSGRNRVSFTNETEATRCFLSLEIQTAEEAADHFHRRKRTVLSLLGEEGLLLRRRLLTRNCNLRIGTLVAANLNRSGEKGYLLAVGYTVMLRVTKFESRMWSVQ